MIYQAPKSPKMGHNKRFFSDESIRSLAGLGVVLQEIRARLKSEENSIKNAKISKNGENQENRTTNIQGD